MADPRLELKTIKVRQLIEDFHLGRLVIPEFQRDIAWKPKRAPQLVDSLYKGFPIASFLVWQGSGETKARYAIPRPERASVVNWLIDGQQRVTAISRVKNGDQGIEVVFHPEEDRFALANAATRNDSNWFRVAELLDDELYRQIRRVLSVDPKGERREAKFERVRKILDYDVPVVVMVDHSFDDAVDAFIRINTLGVRLKREDIESARVAAEHSGFISNEVFPFLSKIRQQGFSRLNIMHLFRACAFVAHPDGRNRTPLNELGKREVLNAWQRTKKAIDQAVGIVRSELGLVNMDILWSGALLVPVIAICAVSRPHDRDSKGLAGWIALAALLHRYSGASDTALDQDLRACRGADPIGALLGNLRGIRSSLAATPSDFTGSLNDRSGLLAAYIACVHRGMRDLLTGGKVLLQGRVDRHHILPRGQFPERQRINADRIANIAFIADDVNRSINMTGPEIYLKKISPAILESQCIPLDEQLWCIENADAFWDSRRQLLADSFNGFLESAFPARRL